MSATAPHLRRPVVARAEAVSKRYGDLRVLDAVDLTLSAGSVLALLGHNGAGKSTLVNILTTVLPCDSGRVTVCDLDVDTHGHQVRERIAVAGQKVALDDLLTGRANLELVARLRRVGNAGAVRERTAELLAQFDLTHCADRSVGTYSGGMRRRLDLAACLVIRPQVLFLDEPTTGMDPVTRSQLWALVRSMAEAGTAILLTTQYLEEAEALADQVVVLDHGRIVAAGSSDEVKTMAGADLVEAHLTSSADWGAALAVASSLSVGEVTQDERQLTFSFEAASPTADLQLLAGLLAEQDIAVRQIGVRQPSLDDVFLHLTRSRIGKGTTR